VSNDAFPAVLPAVVLLDLDDTILDDTGARDRCWQTACLEAAERYPGLDAATLLAGIESVRDWFWGDPDRHRKWRQRMRDAWERIASEALARLGFSDPEMAAFLGDRHFELRDAAIAPLPGAIETLERLRAAGAVLGLITNGSSQGQRAKIERFGLGAHFDYVGIEGEVGCGKPHPVAYETALRYFKNDPEDAWMVGDNLEWDVAGAQAVGILGIWLDSAGGGIPAGSSIRPDRIINSISDLSPKDEGGAAIFG
jgi:putative hydrolase of the HAD superfamily